MEDLELKFQRQEIEDDILVTRVIGEIKIQNAHLFKTETNFFLESSKQFLIIDLGNVKYVDSSGFGILLSLNKKCRGGNRRFFLINLETPIDRILRVTKLDQIFTICANLEEALKTIKSK